MLRDLEKEKLISEDELFEGRDQVQKVTDEFIKQVDEIGKAKEAEIMEV
jgi:ribosome recycling factor